jgi:hypothetical protein
MWKAANAAPAPVVAADRFSGVPLGFTFPMYRLEVLEFII